MKQWKQQITLFASIAGLAMSVFATPPNFERYKIILDKAPFGSVEIPPAPIQPAPPPISNQQAWTKNYRLTMLQEATDGSLLLGLVNNQTKRSIMLREGESDPEENIKFISGNYESSSVSVSKDGDTRQLGANENQVKSSSPPPRAAPPSKRKVKRASSRTANSYAARRASRQKRLADLRKQREESRTKEPALPAPVLQQHLENLQMEAIRKGAPPLPIPITPQMEQQLINEGVLTQ